MNSQQKQQFLNLSITYFHWGCLACLGWLLILMLMRGALWSDMAGPHVPRSLVHYSWWQMILWAPMIEEYLFRALLWDGFAKWAKGFLGGQTQKMIPFFMTSFLFIGAHGWKTSLDSTALIYVSSAGLYLGLLRLVSGRVWLGVLVHMFNNALYWFWGGQL